jgi:Na+-driven multidrug efflux pump
MLGKVAELQELGDSGTDDRIKNGGVETLLICVAMNTLVAGVVVYFASMLGASFVTKLDGSVLALITYFTIPFVIFKWAQTNIRMVSVFMKTRKTSTKN